MKPNARRLLEVIFHFGVRSGGIVRCTYSHSGWVQIIVVFDREGVRWFEEVRVDTTRRDIT